MLGILFKLLMTYVVLSVVGGFIAAGFEASPTTQAWFFGPPTILMGVAIIAGFLGMIWGL